MDAPVTTQPDADEASPAYEPPQLTEIGAIEELTLIEMDLAAARKSDPI